MNSTSMNTSNSQLFGTFFLTLTSLLTLTSQGWSQSDNKKDKRALIVRTNVPFSKLVRQSDGSVLATADNQGIIHWTPKKISKSDCQLEVQADYHLSIAVNPKRKLRKSVPILNSIAMSVLGGSIYGMSVESTEGAVLVDGQVSAGAAAALLGFTGGAMNAGNYRWAKSSRTLDVTLLHTPEYMDKLWVQVKASGSISQVEAFRSKYPEFERQGEIERELARLIFRERMEAISASAMRSLGNPEGLFDQTKELEGHMAALNDWDDEFGDISNEPYDNAHHNLSILLNLLKSPDAPSASDWGGAIEALQEAPSLPFAVAGFLGSWTSSSQPDQTLRLTVEWPEATRKMLLGTSSLKESLFSYVLSDWESRFQWDSVNVSVDPLRMHLDDWRETISQLESGFDDYSSSLGPEFEKEWASTLSRWDCPQALQCNMSKQLMNAWIRLNEEEAAAILATWQGVILPANVSLSSVIRDCDDAKDFLPDGVPIPLTMLNTTGLIPPQCGAHLTWCQKLDWQNDMDPNWVTLPAENDADSTWTYSFQDGGEWRISTLREANSDKKKPWDGEYSGVQPSYAMRNSEGEFILVQGQKVVIPQTRYVLELNDLECQFSQQDMSSHDNEKYIYEGKCVRRTSHNSNILLECDYSTEDGESSSTVTFEVDVTSGQATFKEGPFGPEFTALNAVTGGAESIRIAECIWVYSGSGEPKTMLLAEPHSMTSPRGYVNFKAPIAVTRGSSGNVYPSLIDSIAAGYESLKKHPGLSKKQLSNGRAADFYEVEAMIDDLQYELNALLTCAESPIQPNNMIWSSTLGMKEKLEVLKNDWTDLGTRLTKREMRRIRGTYQEIDLTYGYIYTLVIGEEGEWASDFYFGANEYQSGYVVGNNLYKEDGSFHGKVEGDMVLIYYDGEVGYRLSKE